MNKNCDTKTLKKLLNKYAESYKILENDFNDLKNQNKNLKENLKLNKQIIENFYLENNTNPEMTFFDNVKKENKNLQDQLEKIIQENKELRDQLYCIQQSVFEDNNKTKAELEKFKTKNFLLENILLKKDNVNQNLKNKIERYEDFNIFVGQNELYVLEPTKAIIYLNDEVMMYKDLYDSLVKDSKDLKNENLNYKKKIKILKAEIKKLLMVKEKLEKSKNTIEILKDEDLKNINILNQNLNKRKKFSQRTEDEEQNPHRYFNFMKENLIKKNFSMKEDQNSNISVSIMNSDSDIHSLDENEIEKIEKNGIGDEDNISNGNNVYKNKLRKKNLAKRNNAITSKVLNLTCLNNNANEINKSIINKNELDKTKHFPKNSDFIINEESKINNLTDNKIIKNNSKISILNLNKDKKNEKLELTDINLEEKDNAKHILTELSINLINKKENGRKEQEKVIRNRNFLEISEYEDINKKSQTILKSEEQNEIEEEKEWKELLKTCGLSSKDYANFSKNKYLTKLIELIDCLKNSLREKNFQIKLLIEENQNENKKNQDLYRENSLLIKNNIELVKKTNLERRDLIFTNRLYESKFKIEKKEELNVSMVRSIIIFFFNDQENNTSRISVKKKQNILKRYTSLFNGDLLKKRRFSSSLKELNKIQCLDIEIGNKNSENITKNNFDSIKNRDESPNTSIIFTRNLNLKNNKLNVNTSKSIIRKDFINYKGNLNFIFPPSDLESVSSSELNSDILGLEQNDSGFISSVQESSVRKRKININSD